jgi:hypothetical protein
VNTTFTTKFNYQLETKKPLQHDPQIELQLPYSVTITTAPPILDTQSGKTQIESTDTVDPATGNLHLTILLEKRGQPELSDFSCTIVAHATAQPMCLAGRTLPHYAAGRRPL